MHFRSAVVWCAFSCLFLGPSPVEAQTLERANLLREHGLTDDAKREYIAVLLNKNPPQEKAAALDSLASIAAEENRPRTALASWKRLIAEYPDTAQAKAAKERLPRLAAAFEKSTDDYVADASARIKLRNGDFWISGREDTFRIDSSWIDNLAAGINWYDQVIAEFKGTPAAMTAYEHKIRAMIGWREPGSRNQVYGALADFATWAPRVEATFRDYEAEFPDAPRAQAIRYQIAQMFWIRSSWTKCRAWLNEIIEKDEGKNTFYADLAALRLTKVEH